MIARLRLAAPLTVLALAGCGGSAPPPAEETPPPAEQAPPTEQAPPPEEETTGAETPATPPVPPLPALTAGDPHTRVLGSVDGGCTVRGVEDGGVFVSTASARQSSLVRFAADAAGPTLPTVVHTAQTMLEYRVGHGHGAALENAAGFGTATIWAFSLAGGEPVEVARQIRQSTWALGADGVYWGDPSFTEPHLQRVGWTGGEPVTTEELRPVFDEDRLEQLVLTGGDATYVAVRTRQSQGGGYFCHELRGGPLGTSRTLRRYRRCPSDEELLSAVSVSDEHVYYFRDVSFYRVPRAGSGTPREETVLSDVDGLPIGSATDGRMLVWSQGDGVMRLTIGARARPETIGERARVLTAPVLSGGVVYWARRDEGACVVLARPLDAPALTPPG